MKNINPRFALIISAIAIAVVSRITLHIPNFTPVAAMALFGGAFLSDKRLAIVIPLIALFISDLFIGFHGTMMYVYVAFILTSVIGIIIQKKVTIKSVTGGAIISSILFFIITNFGVWAAYSPQTGIAGLEATYLLGIPFFAPTLISNLIFSGIMFGAFQLAQMKYPAIAK